MVEVPSTIAELRDALRANEHIRIMQESLFDCASIGKRVSLSAFNRVIEWSPEDQVIIVESGITLQELSEFLADSPYCLPDASNSFPSIGWHLNFRTLGDLLLLNLPHSYETSCGNWRDWVLGLKIMLADGTIVNCGSKAVKNVAGYDLQKLIIGSRGTLAIPLELTLRLTPKIKCKSSVSSSGKTSNVSSQMCIIKCRKSDVPVVKEMLISEAYYYDELSFTFTVVSSNLEHTGFPPECLVIRTGLHSQNVNIVNPVIKDLMAKTKSLFDPEYKLNKGEFDFI
jgi:FAD/FMN-containing dehydrogenase